jgi:flavin-dependent dehydrogenase
MTPPRKTDVFVIGGGPAGLAAAIAARLKGFEAAVADPAQPCIDKACGEGLMPESFSALEQLGIAHKADQSVALRGVRFLAAGVSVEANFPGRFGAGMRRLQLHQLLVDRATELGVRLLWGARVNAVAGESVAMDGHTVRCRWVIGADGQNSRVRCWAGLQAAQHESLRYGFRRHYRIAPWSDCIDIHWGDDCQVYVTPVNADEVCIAVLSANAQRRLDSALAQFPELERRLERAEATTAERGAVTASRRLREVYRGNTVLIGDASGSVDAVTAEGLSLSFHQAIALADALASGDLAFYQAEHRRLARRPVFMAGLMLSLDRSPWLRRRVLRAMAAKPEIFANLVAMHVGALSSRDFVFRGMLPLGRQMLLAFR